MAHLTHVIESFDDVYELEPNADGFWTDPLGYCGMVVMLWDPHGSLYRHGRAQHCSGGLGSAKCAKLIEGLEGRGDVLMVLVLGLSNEFARVDHERLKELQTACRENNWTISECQAQSGGKSVVTRSGLYMKKEDYDAQSGVVVPNQAPTRCCVIL